jgi:hypothetical protein
MSPPCTEVVSQDGNSLSPKASCLTLTNTEVAHTCHLRRQNIFNLLSCSPPEEDVSISVKEEHYILLENLTN